MTVELTGDDLALLGESHVGIVATLMRDGSPQLTPVWVDTDGETVLFNTAKDRIKYRNLRRNPMVSPAVVDPANHWRWLSVRGRAEIVEDGALEHVHRLAKKYLGVEQARVVVAENIQALRDADLNHLAVPKRSGGAQHNLRTLVETVAELGRGCGATAWVTALSNGNGFLAGLFGDQCP
ncbi:TIGR03618 family F420-dependent PPOX class oxidoreductase [Streptomyces sp. T028]|uniref:PPOX class F420-dependent oxidoreductase n=1 Tax=Streptomyces sp. T028 TaxID=3394379 RepID=UPI003A8A3C4B